MKLHFSLSWFVLVVAPPPTVFAMVATTKKNKTSDGTSDEFVPVKEPPSDGTSDGTSNGTSDGFFPVIKPPVDDGISPFTGTDGGDISSQRKLSKSSKKVKHPEALCTLSLFADSLFMYANRCFTDIMVTISSCDDKDDMCYISERLPLLPQEQDENQEEEQCFVGGSFPAKQNIRYNPSTGDCEFLYVDLMDDSCNLYTGDDGTGSLGLKARINVKNNPDVMFIQFTNDMGQSFYNPDNERVAVRYTADNDRYLRQEGEMKPVLSMMPHPLASRHRRMTPDCSSANLDGGIVPQHYGWGWYPEVTIRNNTPYYTSHAKVIFTACSKDETYGIASGDMFVGDFRGYCLLVNIKTTLMLPDGSELKCNDYDSTGTALAEFFLMLHDGVCCVRSERRTDQKCPEIDSWRRL